MSELWGAAANHATPHPQKGDSQPSSCPSNQAISRSSAGVEGAQPQPPTEAEIRAKGVPVAVVLVGGAEEAGNRACDRHLEREIAPRVEFSL